MLTPEQIAALRDLVMQITDPINDYLIRDIARRVSQAGQLTSTAAYQVWRAQNLGLSQAEVKKRLAEYLDTTAAEIEMLLTQFAAVGYRFDLERLPTEKAIPFEENTVLQQTIQAAVKLARQDFTNLTQTLGMVDPYGKALPLQDAYRSCIDFAFKQVFTGAADYNTVIRQAVKYLADKGVRTIDYESGVHTSLEAAVRRCVLGGLGLMQEQISQQTHDELGCDGWEITAHAASAPDHEPIQGKQYPDAEFQALNNSLVRRIGTLNCGHAAFPIILGVNTPQYTPAELEKFRTDNEKGVTVDGVHYTKYQATQMQRALERSIRTRRKQILADEATGDKDKLRNDQIKLQRLEQEYARFSKAAGLRTQLERLEVAGFGKQLTKNAALATAPQGPLVQDGEIFDPETAVDSLLKRLENSPGMADNIAVLRYYAEHTVLVEDRTIAGPIAYNQNLDVICYNPDIPLPAGADRDGIFAHELAHRADKLWYNTTQNQAWSAAIQKAEGIVLRNADIVESWFAPGGKYASNAFFSDIISAISKGKINAPYSHSRGYWARAGNCEREIFANLVALDILSSVDTMPVESGLEAIYNVFKELVGGGGLL